MHQPVQQSIWIAGLEATVRWAASESIELVAIELYRGSAFVAAIAAPAPNNGSYSWLVPATTIPDDSYTVVVSNSADRGDLKFTPGPFKILAAGQCPPGSARRLSDNGVDAFCDRCPRSR